MLGWLNGGLSQAGGIPGSLAEDTPQADNEIRPSRVIYSGATVQPLNIVGSSAAALAIAVVTLAAPVVQPPTLAAGAATLEVATVQRSAETVQAPTVAVGSSAPLALDTVALDAPTVQVPTIAAGSAATLAVDTVTLDAPTVQTPLITQTGAGGLFPDLVQLEAPTVQAPTLAGVGAVALNIDIVSLAAPVVGSPVIAPAGQIILLPDVVQLAAPTVHTPTLESLPGLIVPELVTLDAPTVLAPQVAAGGAVNIAPNLITLAAPVVQSPALVVAGAATLLVSTVSLDAPDVQSPTVAAVATPDITILEALADTGATNDNNTLTGTFSVATGTDRLMILFQHLTGNSLTAGPPAPTYGNQALTLREQVDSGGGFPAHMRIWTLDDAGIDAATDNRFRTSNVTNGTYRETAVVLENAHQTDPVVDSGTGIAVSGDIQDVVLATEAGGYAAAGVLEDHDAGDSGINWGSDLTERVEAQTGAGANTYGSADTLTDGTDVTSDPTTPDETGPQQAQAAISIRKA